MVPWILLTVVALAGTLYAEFRGNNALLWVAKPLASAGFIGAAVAAGAFDTIYGQAIFIALAWAFLGDVLLIPRGGGPAFLLGLVAFLIGHLGLAFAFGLRGLDTTWLVAAGGAIALLAVLVWRWLAPHLPARMRIPVIAYIAVISVMVAVAVACWALSADYLVLVGGCLFFVSDLGVARQRFVSKTFANRLATLPLYYAAQHLFAYSITSV